MKKILVGTMILFIMLALIIFYPVNVIINGSFQRANDSIRCTWELIKPLY